MTAKYWNGNGKYQKQNDDLFKLLVPREGKAPTYPGEILRIVNKLYYEHYNNGDWNMDLSDMKRDRATLLSSSHFLPGQNLDWKLSHWNTEYATDEDYDTVVDAVIEWVTKEAGDNESDFQI